VVFVCISVGPLAGGLRVFFFWFFWGDFFCGFRPVVGFGWPLGGGGGGGLYLRVKRPCAGRVRSAGTFEPHPSGWGGYHLTPIDAPGIDSAG
jgi:hypothetical protein